MSAQSVVAKKRFISKVWAYLILALLSAVTLVIISWPAAKDKPVAVGQTEWRSLSREQQTILQRQAFLLFPESFAGGQTQRLASWLAAQNIVHPELSQFYDRSGVQDLVVNNEVYIDAPAPLVTLFNDSEGVLAEMAVLDSTVLRYHWQTDPSLDPDVRFGIWVYKVREAMPPEHFPLFLAIVMAAR